MTAINHYQWVDSHCHFDFSPFSDDPEAHWQFCQAQGLTALIIPGVSRQRGQQVSAYCLQRPWFYAQGLHPYFMAEHQVADIAWLEAQLQQDPKIIAIGEIGLDKVIAKDEQQLALQRQFFSAQVELAQQYRKPLILHVRGFHDEACSFLRHKRFYHGGIVHAFSGSAQQAKAWLDIGFKLGIGGAMTHPRARKLRATISQTPADAWLLETDSPDMRSAFWQPQHHSPAVIPLLAACLASLQGVSLAAVAQRQKDILLALWPSLQAIYAGLPDSPRINR